MIIKSSLITVLLHYVRLRTDIGLAAILKMQRNYETKEVQSNVIARNLIVFERILGNKVVQ